MKNKFGIWLTFFLLLSLQSSSGLNQLQGWVFAQNWLEVLKTAHQLEKEAEENPDLYFLFGYAGFQSHQYFPAIENLKKCLQSSTSLENFSRYYLGKSWLKLGELEQAEKFLSQTLPSNLVYLLAQFDLARIYLARAELERAGRIIYQLRKERIFSEFYPEFLLLEAEFFSAQKKPHLYQEKLTELYINFPTYFPEELSAPRLSPEQVLIRAKKLIQAGEPQKAQKELFALKQNLKRKDRPLLKELLPLLARAGFLARDYQAVLRLEKEAEKYAKSEGEFWFYLAWAYHRLDQEKRAEKIYKRFLSSLKNSSYADRAVFHLARMLQLNGELASARKYYEKLVKVFPKSEFCQEAYFQLGLSYFQEKKFSSAQKFFEKGLKLASEKDRFYYWLARVYQQQKNQLKAQDLKKQLIERFPTSFYSYLADPNPPKGIIPKAEVHILGYPSEFDTGLALARLGLYSLAEKEIKWQLARKNFSSSEILGLVYQLEAVGYYPLAFELFWNQFLTQLGGEQAKYYLYLVYPEGFKELILCRAREYKIEPALAYALIRAESGFDPSCTSSAGAIGLAQIMPALGIKLAEKFTSNKLSPSQLYQPGLNLRLGFYHLAELFNYFQDFSSDWQLVLAIASYNAGKTPVKRWQEQRSELDLDLWIEMIPYPETKRYVKRVLAGLRVYRALGLN